MQSFGEYFKKYLDENSLSYNSVAKKCGIDRTILSKYAKGIMKPKNQKVVLRIVKAIEMPKIKAEMLCEIYKKEMLCEKYGLDYELIEEFYELKGSMLNSKNNSKHTFFHGKEYAENLFTYQEIISAMQYLLENCTFVKMCFCLECEKVQDFLKQDFFYKSDCSIEQIISFNKNDTIKEKLKNFNQLFSYLVHMKDGKIYYQYTDNCEKNGRDLVTNYIITNRGILFFDNKLQQAFFANQQLSCDFYKEIFDTKKVECRLFANAGKELYKILNKQEVYYNRINEKTGVCFCCSKEEQIWITIQEKQQIIGIWELELVQLLKELL